MRPQLGNEDLDVASRPGLADLAHDERLTLGPDQLESISRERRETQLLFEQTFGNLETLDEDSFSAPGERPQTERRGGDVIALVEAEEEREAG